MQCSIPIRIDAAYINVIYTNNVWMQFCISVYYMFCRMLMEMCPRYYFRKCAENYTEWLRIGTM